MPFHDKTFKAVFSTNSLHEWSNAKKGFDEIYRVLKFRGVVYIKDLRRDMNPLAKFILRLVIRDKRMREGLNASINAAYTKKELESILQQSGLRGAKVINNHIFLEIIYSKE